MDKWSAIVLIVALVVFARVMRSRYHAQHGIIHDNAGNQHFIERGPDPEMQRELEDLRKRIAVLERIATDERQTKAIADEIESLRGN